MKLLEVEVVSQEMSRPSLPTPSHLKTFKLCLLDHLIPAPYAPIILFYDPISTVTAATRIELLKSSLSEALTEFYPLTGKLSHDEASVECNDEGAVFIEAKVKHFSLEEFLGRPELFDLMLKQFLPGNMTHMSSGDFVTNVQANVFECGDIAIGVCVSHKLLDGAALCTFMKSWSATCRRLLLSRSSSEKAIATPRICPDLLSAASLFPIKNGDLWLKDSSFQMWGSLFIQGKETSVTKRLVFDASAIATLKLKARMSAPKRPPTRVEVVSAFLWQCFMAASKEKHGVQKPSMLTHIVNLRSKLTNAVENSDNDLEHATGNIFWMAAARSYILESDDDDDDDKMTKDDSVLPGLVGELRNALLKIDSRFTNEILGEQGKGMMRDSIEGMMNTSGLDLDYYGFSSWCKFGWYEAADFGHGKPTWVSSIGSSSAPHFMNLVILVDTKLGDGVEAWVTLDQSQMGLLEANSDLRKLVSVDPSPLNLV